MNLKNFTVYTLTFLVITACSLLLSDLTLLPLIKLQLKHPQVFNYLLLTLLIAWFLLRIFLQYRQEKPEQSAPWQAILSAVARVSLQALGTIGRLLRFVIFFALFVSVLAVALITNSHLLFS